MNALIASFFAGPVTPPVGSGWAAPAIAGGLFGLSLDRLAGSAMPAPALAAPIAFAGPLAPLLLPGTAGAAPMASPVAGAEEAIAAVEISAPVPAAFEPLPEPIMASQSPTPFAASDRPVSPAIARPGIDLAGRAVPSSPAAPRGQLAPDRPSLPMADMGMRARPAEGEVAPPPPCSLAAPADMVPEEMSTAERPEPGEPTEPSTPKVPAGAVVPMAATVSDTSAVPDAPRKSGDAATVVAQAPSPPAPIDTDRRSAAAVRRPARLPASAERPTPGSADRDAPLAPVQVLPVIATEQPAAVPQIANGAQPPVAHRRSASVEPLADDAAASPNAESPPLTALPASAASFARPTATATATATEWGHEQAIGPEVTALRDTPAARPAPEFITQRSLDSPMPSPSDAVNASFAPAPTSTPAPVAALPGRIGHETGVAIARHVAAGGGETIAIRLDPAEMGRVEVRLSFDDRGTLQAVVAADNPASLDLLRRESPELVRALAEAGVSADGGSFRFDARSGSGGGGPAWQRPTPSMPRGDTRDSGLFAEPLATTAAYRPIRTRGRVDLMA